MELSITRSLTELNLLDKKINKALIDSNFVTCRIKGKLIDGIMNDESFAQKAKASNESINALIKRWQQIKSAIVISNALTKVKIAGEEMTVADAIETKKSIEYKKKLLKNMKRQYASAETDILDGNLNVQNRFDNFTNNNNLSKDTNKEDFEKFQEMFMKKNEWILIDPLKIKDKIAKLENEIDEFEAEVDHILTESNTITKINIED